MTLPALRHAKAIVCVSDATAWRILIALRRMVPGDGPADIIIPALAVAVGVSTSPAGRALVLLEDNGLVVRKRGNRKTIVAITARGAEMAALAAEIFGQAPATAPKRRAKRDERQRKAAKALTPRKCLGGCGQYFESEWDRATNRLCPSCSSKL